jgi:hypothetical protein
VHLAGAGDLAAAEQTLAAATAECPARPAAWRELAGVHFLRQQWPDAERAAARAVGLAPGDEHGWRVLAAARYQQADWVGALRAMRATGEPPIDLIEVSGAARTPHPVVIDVTGLSSRMPMTASAFERAARRLADLPIATRSRLTYRPTGSGSMTVEAAVAERDAWPRRWTALAGVAARAAADQTVRIDLGGLARSGELATALWRWSPGRPMAGIRLATPAPARLPGIAVVEGTWEWQTDRPPADGEITQESRKRVGLLLTDWASGSVRWEAEAALERFNARQHAAAGGAIEVHGLADRLAVRTEAAGWAGRDAARFSTGSIELAARSGSSGTSRPWLAARAGLAFASTAAPLALWPGADTGMAGAALLRAHPLPDDGVLSGAVFGRQLWHATLEYGHPLFRHPAADVAVIGFADAARAWRGRAHGGVAPPGTHVDVGAGVRVATPGMRGSLDINVAYGTRDGRVVLSAGVGTPWPSFDGWRDR